MEEVFLKVKGLETAEVVARLNEVVEFLNLALGQDKKLSKEWKDYKEGK